MSIATELEKLKSSLRKTGLYRMDDETLLHCELSAYATGFNIINSNLLNLEEEMFVRTASSYGISYREELFKRKMDYSTLSQRRNMLDYELSITANDFNIDGIKKALSACAIVCTIYENTADKSVFLDCTAVSDAHLSKEKAISLAEKFMPAHLKVYFDFRKINWNKIEELNMSFNQMDACNMSWNEIEEYDIREG